MNEYRQGTENTPRYMVSYQSKLVVTFKYYYKRVGRGITKIWGKLLKQSCKVHRPSKQSVTNPSVGNRASSPF